MCVRIGGEMLREVSGRKGGRERIMRLGNV